MQNTIRFANEDQVVLFVHEIRGQLSDGHWENTSPTGHWRQWCSANVEVGQPFGRNFYASRYNYNLTNKDLLDIVGKRMTNYVKIARRFGKDKVQLFEGFFDLDGEFRGAPVYEGEYWDRVRSALALVNADDVKACVEEDSYTLKDLRKDLREMKTTFRTYVNMG